MKNIVFVFLVFSFALFGCKPLLAQSGLYSPPSAANAAMGGISSVSTDVFSLYGNPAGLAQMNHYEVGFTAENRFLIQGLQNASFVGGMPLGKNGTIGVGGGLFGSDNYAERRLALAYGRKLTPMFRFGGRFEYLNLSIPDYGSASLFTFALGLQTEFFKGFTLGTTIFNPVRVGWTEQDQLPVIFQIGADYQITQKLQIQAEFEQDFVQKPSAKAAISYQMAKILTLRTGIGTNPGMNTFGLGIQLSRFEVDLATSYHRLLGVTPSISVKFKGKERKK